MRKNCTHSNSYVAPYRWGPLLTLSSLDKKKYINWNCTMHSTYDHIFKRAGYPVRYGTLKLEIGLLVVGRVTTGESELLYVLLFWLL